MICPTSQVALFYSGCGTFHTRGRLLSIRLGCCHHPFPRGHLGCQLSVHLQRRAVLHIQYRRADLVAKWTTNRGLERRPDEALVHTEPHSQVEKVTRKQQLLILTEVLEELRPHQSVTSSAPPRRLFCYTGVGLFPHLAPNVQRAFKAISATTTATPRICQTSWHVRRTFNVFASSPCGHLAARNTTRRCEKSHQHVVDKRMLRKRMTKQRSQMSSRIGPYTRN